MKKKILKKDLIYTGAKILIGIIVAPLVVWAGSTIYSNAIDVAKLYEKDRSTKVLLNIIMNDVQVIRAHLLKSK